MYLCVLERTGGRDVAVAKLGALSMTGDGGGGTDASYVAVDE